MEVSLTAQVVDVSITLLALIVSAALIVRFRILGALLGMVSYVLLTYARVYLLADLIPGFWESRSYLLSLALSSFLGFFWCLAILVCKLLYDWWKRSKTEPSHGAPNAMNDR